MKATLVLFVSLLFSTFLYSQTFYSDFEDGTLQGWTNKDGSTTLLTVEGVSPNLFLQKECDGSISPVGEMTIINSSEWAGNYFYSPTGDDEAMRTVDEIFLKNDNDFDLHIRYGFKGENDYLAVTTDPIIVPANSDWNIYEQYYAIEFPGIYNLTILNDTEGIPFEEFFNNVHELFEDVVEFKIFHNEDITFEGKILEGTLQIQSINSYLLLLNDRQDLSKYIVYPNPVNDILTIKLPNISNAEVTIYNILGKKIMSNSFSGVTNQIDISSFSSGMYLITIETETTTVTKKVVKL